MNRDRSSPDVLLPRADRALIAPARPEPPGTAEFAAWFAARARAHAFRVEKIPFAALDRWSFERETGNLVHDSGRFFSVEGMLAAEVGGRERRWHQPIINQPEIGILGIVVKRFDGIPHFLMQAKMEPGNPNTLQLSPTVQATRSNYTKVHHGTRVRYLEYFVSPGRSGSRVIADVLQSEHGSWFFRKRNRNMIVEVFGDVPVHADFRWLTFAEIAELLHRDNLVNMDARTVLACAPWEGAARALHSDAEMLSWFTGERARHELRARLVPLAEVPGWTRGAWHIGRRDDQGFRIVAVSVEAGSREVTSWTQPILEPRSPGLAAFLLREIDGVPHVLVHARMEGGFLDTLELGPTVQFAPGDPTEADDDPPRFLEQVRAAHRSRIRYEAVHAEEGGRFLNAESRYLIVEAAEDEAPLAEPPGYRWLTPGQLASLLRHGHYVNVQARTLIACLQAHYWTAGVSR
jgi:oxidase EvaA